MADQIAATLSMLFSSKWTSDKTMSDETHKLLLPYTAAKRSVSLTYGAAAGMANIHWGDERSLAGSATETLDLQALTADEYGNTLNFTGLKGIIVVNKGTGADGCHILVGGAAATQVAELFGAVTERLRVRSGAAVLIMCGVLDAAGYAVGAGAKSLKILNESASAVDYQIGLIGLKV